MNFSEVSIFQGLATRRLMRALVRRTVPEGLTVSLFPLLQFLPFATREGRLAFSRPTRTEARRLRTRLRVEALESRHLLSGPSGISGFVFDDSNNNGLFDPGERPIVYSRIELFDATGALVGSVLTDTNGSYQFDEHLCPGPYTIVQPVPPAGYFQGRDSRKGTVLPYTDSVNAIPVVFGISTPGNHECDEPDGDADDPTSSLPHNDFGELLAARLSGFVYTHRDANAIKDLTESGLAGVTVTLAGRDDRNVLVTLTTQTASDGSYDFSGLRPGTYAITDTPPPGYLEGENSLGTDGGTAGPGSFQVTLDAGAWGANYNFVELPPPPRSMRPGLPATPPPLPGEKGMISFPPRNSSASSPPVLPQAAAAERAGTQAAGSPQGQGPVGPANRGTFLAAAIDGLIDRPAGPASSSTTTPLSDSDDMGDRANVSPTPAAVRVGSEIRLAAAGDEDDFRAGRADAEVVDEVFISSSKEGAIAPNGLDDLLSPVPSRPLRLLCSNDQTPVQKRLLLTSAWFLSMLVADLTSALNDSQRTASS